jgi:uncharacterized protein YggE
MEELEMPIDRGSPLESVISVVGSCELQVHANVIHIVLEIRTRGTTARDALTENDSRERSVRLRLRGIGIHEESVETSGVTFLPASGDGLMFPGSAEPQGFLAVRNLVINEYVPDAVGQRVYDRVAMILDEASDGGAQAGARHQVNLAAFRSPCVTFAIEDETGVRAEAMRQAMHNARMAADELARAMGAELEGIVSTQILELGSIVQGRWAATVYGVHGIDMPRPHEPGRVMVRAAVAVTYRVRRMMTMQEGARSAFGQAFNIEGEATRRGHVDRELL